MKALYKHYRLHADHIPVLGIEKAREPFGLANGLTVATPLAALAVYWGITHKAKHGKFLYRDTRTGKLCPLPHWESPEREHVEPVMGFEFKVRFWSLWVDFNFSNRRSVGWTGETTYVKPVRQYGRWVSTWLNTPRTFMAIHRNDHNWMTQY